MTTSCSFTLTTTVRVIDRVHDNTTHRRTHTAPAHRTSFTDFAQIVLAITDFTHRRTALNMHAAHFARAQTHLSVSTFARHQHNASTGSTRHLRAFTRQHLDAVHRGADWNIANWQAV